MIALRDLRFGFGTDGFQLALPRLEVGAGEHLAVVGPSGSGKTTLLNLIAGILRPAAGEVRVDGCDLSAMPDRELRAFRIRHIGFVFQTFGLVEYLRVRDNILYPARLNPALALTPALRARAAALAEAVGLGRALDRFPAQLSQGERQRVAIARALLIEPRVILADEPTGNFDPETKTRVLDLLFAHSRAAGATLVTVTHDRDLLPRFDRVCDFRALAAI